MCTEAEGRELSRVFNRYFSKREVDESDREILDNLYVAGYIDYSYSDKKLYAEASDGIGRVLGKTQEII